MLKLIIIIFLASFFSENPIIKKNYLEIIFTTAILVIAALSLLIFQRDFGTAIIFAGIYIVMLFFAIKKKRVLLYSSLLLFALVLVGYNFIDLIRIRFQGWIMPWSNAQTTSYQIIQSLMSIAAGGLFGTGLGMGYPNLVPLSHSDFVFSAIVEESGLLGGVALIMLLLMFFYQGIKIAITTRDRFFQFLAAGITVLLSIQSILIIGGNIRLLPITGVTLPFLSYGGSSLLVSSIGMYILIVISDQAPLDDDLYQSKTPYKLISAIISFSYVALALTIGWWGIYRAQDLQTRPDNARTLISNIFVKRGTIFSRNNRIFAESTGSPGFFSREYAYPPLSNTVGYISQKYGLFGLEESNDDFLRGIKGYPSSDIWLNFLLYDQPPEGRPIRLTIDQKTQERADQLLNGTKGAVMVLNPEYRGDSGCIHFSLF